ncbi:hypothetical protein [Pseudomonas viridiflava]|nr:hypothetical protein [Pseudomonas viridiflava]WKW33131.1 hypothetical protein KIH13_04330 [Pseudomonas viridiflava]
MITPRFITVACFCFSMLCTPWAQADEEKTETTLCSVGEKIYFSCAFFG